MRRLVTGVTAVLILCLAGCGGDDDDGGPPIVQQVDCTVADLPAADRISMDCSVLAPDLLLVEVEIGGPTTSTDIYGIKFDLVFDPLVVSFTPPAVEGNFLGKDGSATIFQATLSPGDPGRLVVATTRLGAVRGVAATGSAELVFAASFRGVSTGTTDVTFENEEVVDSNLQMIPSIQFGAPLSVTYN